MSQFKPGQAVTYTFRVSWRPPSEALSGPATFIKPLKRECALIEVRTAVGPQRMQVRMTSLTAAEIQESENVNQGGKYEPQYA